MSEEILVDFAIVDQVSGDLQSTTSELQSILEGMEAGLAPLAGQWTGDASEAYQALQRQWRVTIGEMVELLGGLSGVIGEAHSTYTSTEDAIREAWA